MRAPRSVGSAAPLERRESVLRVRAAQPEVQGSKQSGVTQYTVCLLQL